MSAHPLPIPCIRRALSLAIDRKALVERVLQGAWWLRANS
jgi:ABC-type transport system substrate-binding protein